jgi:hypothetical protein
MSMIIIGIVLLASLLIFNKLRESIRLPVFDKIVGFAVIVSAVLK